MFRNTIFLPTQIFVVQNFFNSEDLLDMEMLPKIKSSPKLTWDGTLTLARPFFFFSAWYCIFFLCQFLHSFIPVAKFLDKIRFERDWISQHRRRGGLYKTSSFLNITKSFIFDLLIYIYINIFVLIFIYFTAYLNIIYSGV